MKYVPSKQWKNHNDVTDFIPVLFLLALKIFYIFSSVSIVDFDQVNVSWKMLLFYLSTNARIRPVLVFSHIN